jgi:predicted transcriptional regulator
MPVHPALKEEGKAIGGLAMSETYKVPAVELQRMTADITAAYVRNHTVPHSDLPAVIQTIHRSLHALTGAAVGPENLTPAVPIKESVKPDYIVCLEDGMKMKMLKRHLRHGYDLTPEAYRAKWGLPADYPMTAPNYSKQRSAFAKKIGLGRK